MRGAGSRPGLDDASEAVIASLPAELSGGRKAVLDFLRGNLSSNEILEIVAGASSPDPGIVALTSHRLMFVYASGRRRRKLMCSATTREDLRGCRQDDHAVLVLRFKLPALRFEHVVPGAAAAALTKVLRAPLADEWLDMGRDPTTRELVRRLSSYIPSDEHLLVVAEATSGVRGVVAVTEQSLLWLGAASGEREVAYAVWGRSEVPGARVDDRAVLVLRSGQAPLRFTDLHPSRAGDEIAEALSSGSPLEAVESGSVPPSSVPATWPSAPGVRLTVELASPWPVATTALERQYEAGLIAMWRHQPRIALEYLRSVAASDTAGRLPSAQLLAVCLASQLGDKATVAALGEAYEDAEPVDHATQARVRLSVELFIYGDQAEPQVVLSDALSQPRVAAHVARAGYFLGAWHKEADDDRLNDAIEELARARVRSEEARPQGIDEALCILYQVTKRWDRLLEIVETSSFLGLARFKAHGLAGNGLTDAALAAFEDAIREGEQKGVKVQYIARYEKAEMLLEMGDPVHARRELDLVYAGAPSFEDVADLRERIGRALRDPARLPGELNARIPRDETLTTVAEPLDHSGLLGRTEKSLVWVSLPRQPGGELMSAIWDRNTSAWDAMPRVPRELQQALCVFHEKLEEWDKLLEVSSRSWFTGADLFKANALRQKGFVGPAIVAYDDAIRDGKKAGLKLEHIARYRKAGLLIDIGEATQARRELDRLLADAPAFIEDARPLLDRLETTAPRTSREPIPEKVRHAVWRRDQGRCVQCGSQENLEFDHRIPVSRGGANTERNLQLLCESCNRRKGARI